MTGQHRKPEEFKADLARGLQRFHEKLNLVIRGTGRRLANEISSGGKYSPGTPIKTGYHRANWHAAIDGPAAIGTVGGDDSPDPEGAKSDMEFVADRLEVGQTIYMTNHGPAIRRLEFDGWSPQAPNGFVQPAVEAIQPIVDEVVSMVNAEVK